jgi:hypothetical protein
MSSNPPLPFDPGWGLRLAQTTQMDLGWSKHVGQTWIPHREQVCILRLDLPQLAHLPATLPNFLSPADGNRSSVKNASFFTIPALLYWVKMS